MVQRHASSFRGVPPANSGMGVLEALSPPLSGYNSDDRGTRWVMLGVTKGFVKERGGGQLNNQHQPEVERGRLPR